jgi:predicted transposase YdaD
MAKIPKAEFDKAWKEILGTLLPDFISFFFPQAYEQIAWNRGFQFLDKELAQISRGAKIGTRFADKLVQVRTKQHRRIWVLIHIEVQNQKDRGFAERMFIYYYKIFDRYKKKVASLAILGDTNSKWRPTEFKTELLNCRLSREFPMVKLSDYKGREKALEDDENPFALVVLTHLAAKKRPNNPARRFGDMDAIAMRMYKKDYPQNKVDSLTKFMDWVMALPKELAVHLREKIHQYEEGSPVQHVTIFEKLAKAEGRQEGRQEGIKEGVRRGVRQGVRQGVRLGVKQGLELAVEFKFGKEGLEFVPIIAKFESAKELTTFKNRLKKALTVSELKKFYT